MEFCKLDNCRVDGVDYVFPAWTSTKVHAGTAIDKRELNMNKFINLDLLSHPLNWLIIFLMLVIAAIAGHELLSLFGTEPAS